VGFARTWVVVPGVELCGEWISAAVGIPSRARGKMEDGHAWPGVRRGSVGCFLRWPL